MGTSTRCLVRRARAQSEAIDSRLRYRLMDFQIKQATAAVQIAAGPNPSINAVDMVVLASLTRKSAAHNLPEIMGSKAQPIIETFARLEKGAWPLVDFLTPAQEADLRRRLAAWAPDAASLDSVAFNRLEDIAKASGLPANEQSAPNSILALIGVDPFSGLRPAVREMERSRILGERAIYYAERTPMLLDLQTRALGAAVADMPETRSGPCHREPCRGVRCLACGHRCNVTRDLQQGTRGNDRAVTDCHGATTGRHEGAGGGSSAESRSSS